MPTREAATNEKLVGLDVEPAELPTAASSPKPKRNGVLGAVLGLLLGIGLAFLLERLNRRLRDPEEAREAFGLPVLGTVPESKAIMASNEGVVTAGAPPPNPAELLESHAMNEALAALRERYELVVIDTAPLGVVSDAFPLLGQVDGTIVVARMGQSMSDSAERLREQLGRLEAPVLGVVANGIKVSRGGKYGYSNYGGYGYAEPSEQGAGAEVGAGGGERA